MFSKPGSTFGGVDSDRNARAPRAPNNATTTIVSSQIRRRPAKFANLMTQPPLRQRSRLEAGRSIEPVPLRFSIIREFAEETRALDRFHPHGRHHGSIDRWNRPRGWA
jgi:hypothetical protein